MMHPKTAPPHIKAALRRTFAIERLRKAARAMLDDETVTAKGSYECWDFERKVFVWNDDVWAQADLRGFRIAKELRLALKEFDRAIPTQSAKACDE